MDGTECAPGKVAAVSDSILRSNAFQSLDEIHWHGWKYHPDLSVTSFPVARHCSGALRATASGDPARSLRDTTGAGVPGQSLAPAPERAEAAFAPAAGSATTLRECRSSEENFPAQIVATACVLWCCKSENEELDEVLIQKWLRIYLSRCSAGRWSYWNHICCSLLYTLTLPNSFTLKEEKWQKLDFIINHKEFLFLCQPQSVGIRPVGKTVWLALSTHFLFHVNIKHQPAKTLIQKMFLKGGSHYSEAQLFWCSGGLFTLCDWRNPMLVPQRHILCVHGAVWWEVGGVFSTNISQTSVSTISFPLLGCWFVKLCKINKVKPEKEGVFMIVIAVWW